MGKRKGKLAGSGTVGDRKRGGGRMVIESWRRRGAEGGEKGIRKRKGRRGEEV